MTPNQQWNNDHTALITASTLQTQTPKSHTSKTDNTPQNMLQRILLKQYEYGFKDEHWRGEKKSFDLIKKIERIKRKFKISILFCTECPILL